MNIVVIGAGGVGGYFGGMLADAGADVTLVARGAHLQAIREHGLKIEHPDGRQSVVKVKTLDSTALDQATPNASGTDLVLVAVKGSQLEQAAALVPKVCQPGALVLPLLNGISAPALLKCNLPDHEVLGGLCGIIAQIKEPGVIKHVGIEPFVTFGVMNFGNQSSATATVYDALQSIDSTFRQAQLKATIATDIQLSMWRKFIFICPLSAATSVTRATIGELRSIPESMQLFEQLLDETVAVGMASNVPLTPEHRDFVVKQVFKSPQDGTTSMQRDIRNGKPSELETQVGAVIELGREHGVPTPALSFARNALMPQEIASRKDD